MQIKAATKFNFFYKKPFLILYLFYFISNSLFSQQYSNGNLSTGTISSNNVAAPVGYTWSEVQTGNEQAGYGAQIANNFTIADNFPISTASWTVSKITFFAYSTGYVGATSPFTELRFQIFNTDPSVGNPTPVFGDLATNRLTSSSTSGMYRIFNSTPNTLREIWKLEANVNTVLNPGNYWIEWQTGVASGVSSNLLPASTVIGTTTQQGNNAKQHDLSTNLWSNIIDSTTIPNNFQDFPFLITYTTSTCTGIPLPGNTTSTVTTSCPGTNFTLGITNTFYDVGITYQWQSSSDNITYTNITGGVNNTLTTNLATATWYRLAVTCSSNLSVGYSTPIQIAQTPATGCYCSSSATSIRDEEIWRVKVGTLDNTSTCESMAPGPNSVMNRYSNYTSGVGAPAPANIVSGGGNPITIQIGTCNTGSYTNSVAVWVDMNQNGIFESNEKAYVSTVGTRGAHTETGELLIPSTALSGITLMRVVSVETGTPGNINPCGTYTWGETEDYLVNISPCTPALIVSEPTNATANCGGNASFTVGTTGDFPSFIWEYKTSSSLYWNFVTDGGMYSGATTNTLNITGATNAMNGYKYRVIYIGACSATDFSNTVILTVKPFVATVEPSSSTICNGSSQIIQITNLISSTLATTTVASGTVNTVITDGNDAGVVSAPINISGIPSGSTVSNINIKFDVTHTWIGDVHINLIAPNGQILNLVGALNNGTGSNSTTNFTNTVISSTSTNLISGAVAPRTGTFAAEKRVGFGPTGYLQTATDWPAMFTILNGDWKLAMADFGFGDEGTLVSWEISITYSMPTYAEGSWTPTTGLFTNAALTTPYIGGDTNTVYAAPTTSTNYTVVVVTPTCTSSPLVIPISVISSGPAPTVSPAITQTLISNFCGARKYRYTAATTTNATGYNWILPTSVGGESGVTLDSGNAAYSRVIILTFASNKASIAGDSIKVRAYSGCGATTYKAAKLSNTALNVPAVATAITITPLITNVCGNRVYRYSVPALPVGTATSAAATGYVWEFVGSLSEYANIDSGDVNSQKIIVSYTSNSAAAAGDSIKFYYTSGCGNSLTKAAKLSNTALKEPAAPTGITITALQTNVCGARKYRYSAPSLPTASATAGAANGYVWNFVGTLASTITIDSGGLNSQMFTVTFTSNAASAAGDSVRVYYTSDCGNSLRKAAKLSNTSLVAPAAPTAVTITALQTNVCNARRYRYSAPNLPLASTTAGAASGFVWDVIGSLASTMTIDSGDVYSQRFTVTFTSNAASAAGDSVRVLYTTAGCGNSARKAAKLSNTLLAAPAAPAAITIATKSDVCNARTYRYIAPAVLPGATTTAGAASGYLWSTPTGTVGSTGTIDSGNVTSRIITVTYTSNAAAGAGDSIRLRYTSAGCGNGGIKAQKLSNLVKTGCVPIAKNTPTSRVPSALPTSMEVKVYPNPTTSQFNVQVKSSSTKEAVVIVLDLTGRFIKRVKVSSNSNVNLGSDLKAGAYMLEIKQGKEVKTVRVVKF